IGDGVFQQPDRKRSTDFASNLADIFSDEKLKWIKIGDSLEYLMLADGLDLLSTVPNIREYGIISNGRMFDFTAPLMTKPVLSFPVWPTDNLEYMNNGLRFDDDVDLVMISPEVARLSLLNDLMFIKMADEFVACRQSAIWTMYAREQHFGTICDLEPKAEVDSILGIAR
ncbi:MAG: hypothetical protein AAF556_10595, partial [Pseudomonadota bacterium]